jgi:hypothetical protein
MIEHQANLHTLEEKENTGYYPLSLACNAALSLVGGVGSAVESCVAEMNQSNGRRHHDSSSTGMNALLRSEGSLLTLDTYERYELEDEIDRLERLNSWETNGSLGTTQTLDTAGDTVNTGFTQGSNSVVSPVNGTPKTPTGRKKTGKKKGKKRKKRKKVVNFEYPPISSMKEVPRVTTEQMKDLFFTEDELDEYERDRKHNISDDVEVVAVQYSSSEESEEDSDEFTFKKTQGKFASSTSLGMETMNVNDQSKSILREGKWKQKIDLTDPGGCCDHLNQLYSKSTTGSSSMSFKGSRNVISSPRYKSSRSNDSSASQASTGRQRRESGKLKGVQIYLRPRSTGRN